MISALAISLAIAFWQPYTPTPICPHGITIHPETMTGDTVGQTYLGGGCEMWIDPLVTLWPVSWQCELIAHELGHSVFSLPHTTDRSNVMFPVMGNPPGACKPAGARVRVWSYKQPRQEGPR